MPQASDKPTLTRKRGLECPKCGCEHFRVLYTRAATGGRLLRRRECRYCGRRITTYEQCAATSH
jgi:transcriptional regulator NrdR family protein